MKSRVFVSFEKEAGVLLLLLSVSLACVFWGVNGGAYAEELRYMIAGSWRRGAPPGEQILAFSLAPAEAAAPSLSEHREYRIVISKIGVEAPVVVPDGETTEDVLAALERGVGLYPHSSLPGERGRAILLGHSSRASWYRGGYATVFTLIKELDPGDTFTLASSGERHTYEVFSREQMSPDAANALLSVPSDGAEAALITCYPIGSASRRMVVRARLLRTEYAAQ